MKKKFIFSFIFIIICFLSSCSLFYDEDTQIALSKSKFSYVFDLVQPGYHFVSWQYGEYDDADNKIMYQDKDDSLYELLISFRYEEIDCPQNISNHMISPLYKLNVYSEYDSNNKMKLADDTVFILVYRSTICVTYIKTEKLASCDKTRYYSISDDDFELLINKLELMSIEDNIVHK